MEYIVNTPSGAIRGVPSKREGAVAYKGIRYATAERFEYPKEVISWEGIYDATAYGAASYQPRAFYNEEDIPKKAFYYNEFRRGEVYDYSEDCLFLNIFAPADVKEKLPVIIYIHGGGFVGGCGNEKHFDEPIWPEKGVIGVTLNYRLGPLGFAVLPVLKAESGRIGNYGLYDQLAAIKWIKRNIGAFGGDADNITLMGQSAGAMSVQLHCLSPLSRGIFHKAVMCSGGGVSSMMSPAAPEKKYGFWKKIMTECGASTAEELRAVPVKKLFEVWQANKQASMGGGCSPCIDGELVTGLGCDILNSGDQHKIPYMMGSTSHDVVPPFIYSMAKKWCQKQSTPSYLWFFERNLPGDSHGAWHSSDLWYWFGTLDNCWRPFTDRDYALSSEMTDRLAAFAYSGDPNADGYVNWESGAKKALSWSDTGASLSNPSPIRLWKTMLTNKAPGE